MDDKMFNTLIHVIAGKERTLEETGLNENGYRNKRQMRNSSTSHTFHVKSLALSEISRIKQSVNEGILPTTQQLIDTVKVCGGTRELSKAIGYHPETVAKWVNPAKPHNPTLKKWGVIYNQFLLISEAIKNWKGEPLYPAQQVKDLPHPEIFRLIAEKFDTNEDLENLLNVTSTGILIRRRTTKTGIKSKRGPMFNKSETVLMVSDLCYWYNEWIDDDPDEEDRSQYLKMTGLNRKELASHLGSNQASISNWAKSGKTFKDPKTLVMIKELFKAGYEEFKGVLKYV